MPSSARMGVALDTVFAGSGKFGCPCDRMHCAKASAARFWAAVTVRGCPTLFGRKDLHAR